MSSVLNEALKLVRIGFIVTPLHPGQKVPHGTDTYSTNAFRLEEQCRRHWAANQRDGLGILVMEDTKYVCVDFDFNHGATDDDLKLFPRTVTSKTRKGFHLYYKRPKLLLRGGALITINDGRPWNQQPACLYVTNHNFVAPPTVVNIDKGLSLPDFEYRWHEDAGGSLSPFECELAEVPEFFFEAVSAASKPLSFAMGNAPLGVRTDAGQYAENHRHRMLTRTATKMRASGASDQAIFDRLIERGLKDCNPPLDLEDRLLKEASDLVAWSAKKVMVAPVPTPAEAVEGETLPPAAIKRVGKPEKEPALLLANEYMYDMGYTNAHGGFLRYFQNEFYVFTTNQYVVHDKDRIEASINRWLEETGRVGYAGGKPVGEMMNCMRAEPRYIPSSFELPLWSEEGQLTSAKHLLPLQNGLFDLRHYCETGEAKIYPHTCQYISRYCLPFTYDENAKCPTFDRVMERTFGSAEKEGLWEEVLGIHLYQPLPLEYFFMLQGDGSNGKSVLVLTLTCLLGEGNCSSVPLNNFRPGDFTFSATLGKLANIVSDQGEIDKFDEGMLKQFVTREPMTFNRKHKPAITARPTAFITISTNHLPNFADKSDGIWRRLVLFQLKNQVKEEERDSRLIQKSFWEESGELSGIFNRALKGLRRVAERGGRLADVVELKQDAKALRSDLNPVSTFVTDSLKPVPGARLASSSVYLAYCNMMIKAGQSPLGSRNFISLLTKEIARSGIGGVLSTKNERIGSYSGRVWHGIGLTYHGKQFCSPNRPGDVEVHPVFFNPNPDDADPSF